MKVIKVMYECGGYTCDYVVIVFSKINMKMTAMSVPLFSITGYCMDSPKHYGFLLNSSVVIFLL